MVGRQYLAIGGIVGWTLVALVGLVRLGGVVADRFPVDGRVALVSWLVVWLAGVAAIRWWEAGAWRALVRDGGFEATEAWSPAAVFWSRRPALRKTIRGRPVTVTTRYEGDSWQARTEFVAPADADAAVGFDVVPRSPFAPRVGRIGTGTTDGAGTGDATATAAPEPVEAPTGDETFDGQFVVLTRDPERARAVLGPELRQRLVELDPPGEFVVEPSGVEHSVGRKLVERESVDRHVEAVVALAESVEEAAGA